MKKILKVELVALLRKNGWKFKKIAEVFGTSKQRVHQLSNPQKYLPMTEKSLVSYPKEAKRFVKGLPQSLRNEIRFFQGNQTRQRSFTDRKAVLVKHLRDNYNTGFLLMGQIFNMHHSSVIHLYYRK